MRPACARLATAAIGALIASITTASPRQVVDTADVSRILDAASSYVAGYVRTLSSVVSEERYEQEATFYSSGYVGGGLPGIRSPSGGIARPRQETVRRVLVSDYLLVQVPGSAEWIPFRDVYSVDGVAVRDHDNRLLQLFVHPGAGAVSRALEIREESSRYNIGDATRDINVPTLALHVLEKEIRGGFAFRQGRRSRIDGVDVIEIEYRETGTPTMVRARDWEDEPASGRFSLRSDTGAVMRSVFETRPAHMRTRIEVEYRFEPKLQILVPAEMREYHQLPGQTVTGHASYSNFRRFQVDTVFDIK
jgi:hypothetical protein